MSLLHDFAMLRIMPKFSFRAISTWERITHPQTPAGQEMSRGYVRGGKIVALHITMLISGENSMLCMSDTAVQDLQKTLRTENVRFYHALCVNIRVFLVAHETVNANVV
jgi:hypothetical protein